jgi:hypothetical protein
MDIHQIKWNEEVAKKIIDQLGKRGMEGSYSANAAEAGEEIIAMIPKGSKVYRCGSMTAVHMDLWQGIAKIPGVEIIDPFRPGLSFEDSIEPRRQGLLADVMITSTNAITLDGKLVNLDGLGNRVSAMIFGCGSGHVQDQVLRRSRKRHANEHPNPLRRKRGMRRLQNAG